MAENSKSEKQRKRGRNRNNKGDDDFFALHPEIKKVIFVIIFLAIAIFLVLAPFDKSGPAGQAVYSLFNRLFGVGYYLLPFISLIIAISFAAAGSRKIMGVTLIGAFVFVLSGLGLIDIVLPAHGGMAGSLIGLIEVPLGKAFSVILTFLASISALIATVNKPFHLALIRLFKKGGEETTEENKAKISHIIPVPITETPQQTTRNNDVPVTEAKNTRGEKTTKDDKTGQVLKENNKALHNYVPPDLSLLDSKIDHPTIGTQDLQRNSEIIQKTLESFGINVEMGTPTIGPTVTRYTLKPVQGVKLSRITALNQDMALSLAAHPIRIEAPIPGKALVGIEVPNRIAAIVRLGSMVQYHEFQKAGPLTFCLGRSVGGDPVFPDLSKMPHILIAGATGSGKSITLHTILMSFLFKNSPEMLKLILIDPKRVELSTYNSIPHLHFPVITENKNAIKVLRWAVQQMDERYKILFEAGVRDIRSFNKNKKSDAMPFMVLVIDEMADLMSSYGREVEGLIIRLAQMARATGIHLILSTQRPSVEVITGLIKANITSRIALQVASQIDSRTILDTAGAEKLLGRGDLLFSSAELSKPQRIQGAYVSEEEVKKVIDFIAKNNPQFNETEREDIPSDEKQQHRSGESMGTDQMSELDLYGDKDNDDELYNEAVELVRSTKKASTSFLQRRLGLGYARAARIIDNMEERGVVSAPMGPSKQREVLE